MSSPSEITKSLEEKLSELESKAKTVEDLASQIKSNEKKLLEMSNSTLSYISQLKAKHRDNSISSVTLATKLEETISNIEKTLKDDPSSSSIDKTIEELQKILKDDKKTADDKKDDGEKKGTDGKKDDKEKKENKDKGFIENTITAINNLVSGSEDDKKPEKKQASSTDAVSDVDDDVNIDVDDVQDGTDDFVVPKPASMIERDEQEMKKLPAKKTGMDEAIEQIAQTQNSPGKNVMKGGYRYNKVNVKKTKRSSHKSSKHSIKTNTHKSSKHSSKTRSIGRGKKKKTMGKHRRVRSHFTKTRKRKH